MQQVNLRPASTGGLVKARAGLGRAPPLARSYVGPANSRQQRLIVLAASTFQGTSFQGTVRPYTLRSGDTLQSIAKKRDISVDQLVGLNPDMNPSQLSEGDTILLPAAKLSARDKEILDGIGTGYRLYPVRSGESLEDITSKRKISLEEIQALNPGIDTKKVHENQILKLPANKFTVREREMLIGSGIVPPEFFEAAKNPFVIGVGALLGVCGFVLAWMKFYRDPDFDDDEPSKAKL